jgi:hypothetical protein
MAERGRALDVDPAAAGQVDAARQRLLDLRLDLGEQRRRTAMRRNPLAMLLAQARDSGAVVTDHRAVVVAQRHGQRRWRPQQPRRRLRVARRLGQLVPGGMQRIVVSLQRLQVCRRGGVAYGHRRRALVPAQPLPGFRRRALRVEQAGLQRLQHQAAAGEPHLHVEPRPLHRVDTGDLHQQHLPGPLDRHRLQGAVGLARQRVLRADQAGLALADAHEPFAVPGRLDHAQQDVARRQRRAGPVDVQLDQPVALQQRNARLVRTDLDQDAVCHRRTSG